MWAAADHLTDEEVVATIGCPLCKARVTLSCVYVGTGAAIQQISPATTSPAQRAKLDRIGTPTKRPHNQRRAAADRAKERVRAQLELEAVKANIPRATRERMSAWRAEREFDRREQDQLIAWLRCHGSILTRGNA